MNDFAKNFLNENWKAMPDAPRFYLSAFGKHPGWNDHLDACHGSCVLKRPALADEVSKSLRHFDGDRYQLHDFVVMPNHVHLLATFPTEDAMVLQCESWKHFTATKLNRLLKRKNRFWLQEAFDHLVRSAEQFEHLRRYIAENPQVIRIERE